MKYLAILVVCAVGFAAAASYGDYVPKAYFVIDENGNPSQVYPINTDSLNRVRRQIQPFQPFGQPQFGFANFPNIQPGQGQGTFVSSSQTLNSRFGEDEPVVTGQSTVIHSTGNKVHQTNTYLRPDGTTYTQSGRVKRQQSQTQSQQGNGGSQIQSQKQDGPGGSQNQIQSQGQNIEPIATPAATHPVGDHSSQPAQLPPQGSDQQYAPQYPQGNAENRNQGSYPQQPQDNYQQQPQGNYQPGFAPFGFGAFGPAGFPQAGFGFPQAGFGFPQAGFGGPGFGFGQPGFIQPGFGVQPGFAPQPGAGSSFTGSRIDSRFSDDDGPTGTSGGSTTFTSNNGVFHSTSSVLGPDGKVITRHSSGKL